MKKTTLVCDGCGTEQRKPTVALADTDLEYPERGLYVKEWKGMHLCLSCKQVYGRIQRGLKPTVFNPLTKIYVREDGPVSAEVVQVVRSEIKRLFEAL